MRVKKRELTLTLLVGRVDFLYRALFYWHRVNRYTMNRVWYRLLKKLVFALPITYRPLLLNDTPFSKLCVTLSHKNTYIVFTQNQSFSVSIYIASQEGDLLSY